MTQQQHSGRVVAIEPDSFAEEAGVQVGDEVLEVNGQPVEDVIDVQYYASNEWVELKIARDRATLTLEGTRYYEQSLGIEFEHPTFDIDIRRCNNLCPFCFVLQTPQRMRRTLYIKDDDYRYSFLYGHFVTLTNLSPHDWDRIAGQHLSPLYVSVHATELEVRRQCLRNSNAPNILEQLRWLADHDIKVHTQLVLTPGLNDGPHIGQSIRDLAEFWPSVQSVCVVPVGITRYNRYQQRPFTIDELRFIVDEVHGYQKDYLQKFGSHFAYLTDEWYLQLGKPIPPQAYYDGLSLEENGQGMVRNFLEDWKKVKREVRNQKIESRSQKKKRHHYASATLVTGTLFAPTLRKVADEFASMSDGRLGVVPIVNTRLGESITVAGLLMGEDVITQLQSRELGGIVVLPRIMFDHPRGISLDDKSVLDVARALNRPVALADAMGDVWEALMGENPLTVQPTNEIIPLEVMKAGGWAVEKYL